MLVKLNVTFSAGFLYVARAKGDFWCRIFSILIGLNVTFSAVTFSFYVFQSILILPY